MRIKVHAAVQHPLHDNLSIIEHDMATNEQRAISHADLGAIPASLGRFSTCVHRLAQIIEIPIRLALAER